MTTFTLRTSGELARNLSSGRMRSWIADFLRQPHSLPPDPGPGQDRISLTLPSESVRNLAGFLRCSPSEALRRLALEAIGPSSAVPAAQREVGASPRSWGPVQTPVRPRATKDNQESTQDIGREIVGLISSAVFCVLMLTVWFFFQYRKGKVAEGKHDNMTAKDAVFVNS